MRVLVTGVTGFVGEHLVALAADRGAEVVGVARGAPGPQAQADFFAADLADAGDAERAIVRSNADAVIQLAGAASVRNSWDNPRAAIDTNVGITYNVLEAVRRHAPSAPVLVVGSGETYGPVAEDRQPIAESELLRPQNPYAVSKAAADLLAGFYADAHGLTVIRTRAFNHAGPGQSDAYVVSAFARQIAEAEIEGRSEVTLATGDLRPERDFSDVRDVVRAYWALLEHGAPGVYNVCSGECTSVAGILAGLAAEAKLAVHQETDERLLRSHEVMRVRGSHDRLTAATGWTPATPLARTLADTLDWWRERLSAAVQ